MRILIEAMSCWKNTDTEAQAVREYAQKVYGRPFDAVQFPEDVFVSVKLLDVFYVPKRDTGWKRYEAVVHVYEVKECVMPIVFKGCEWVENNTEEMGGE